MAFSFSSPFEQYFDHDVTIKQVDVPTQTGAVGILPIHVPTLGCLAPGNYCPFRIQPPNPPFLGVMNVYTAEGTQSFFVSSGSYTVNSDSTVSIIAEEACRLADLDKEAATKALATAQVKLVENTG